MALTVGRQGRLYAKKESSYGTDPTLAAGNVVRHIDNGFTWDPKARVNSPEKKATPGPFNRFDRKQSAAMDLRSALLRPSGTLNTLGECDPYLEAGFGAVTNRTNSSTVQASPAPTASVFTIAAGDVATAGYVVGDAVLVTVTGESGPFVRWISAIATDALTVEPDLPAAPTAGDAVKGCITYKLTTDLAISLYLGHFHNSDSLDRACRGAGVDALGLKFDQNVEAMFSASGPAMDVLTKGETGMPTDPATITTVGNQPPSGLTGNLFVNDAVYLFKKIDFSLANGLAVRNTEYGVNAASELYRAGARVVGVSLDAWAETEATLANLAEAGTYAQILKQTGFTEGNIIGVYCPRVDFTPQTQDDPQSEVSWAFSGVATESALDQGDEISLALA